jgi:hypothetical protein
VTFQLADPRGALLASVFFGAVAIFFGVAAAVILKRLAAPEGEPSYYGTTTRARRAIGGIVTSAFLAVFWYSFWGGFYTLTIDGSTVELEYRGPARSYSFSTAGLQLAWVPAGKMQQALRLTTAEGTTYASQATSLSRDQRAAIESLLAGKPR